MTASAPAGVLQDAFLSPCVATIARPGQRRTVTMKGQGNTLTRCAPCGLAQRGAAPLDAPPSPGGRVAGGKTSLHPCHEGGGLPSASRVRFAAILARSRPRGRAAASGAALDTASSRARLHGDKRIQPGGSVCRHPCNGDSSGRSIAPTCHHQSTGDRSSSPAGGICHHRGRAGRTDGQADRREGTGREAAKRSRKG